MRELGRSYYFKFFFVITLGLMVIGSGTSVFAHLDDGEKKRDDRIYVAVKNESQNTRSNVSLYFMSITHTGHDHPWIGDQGVIICSLGTMNPGQTKVCHGPWHSQKSPDGNPECNPVSDWNFTFVISYEEGGQNKNTAVQNAQITGVQGAARLVSGFSWNAHTEQNFTDIPCQNVDVPLGAPAEAPPAVGLPAMLSEQVKIEEKDSSCPIQYTEGSEPAPTPQPEPSPIPLPVPAPIPPPSPAPRPEPSDAPRPDITEDLDPDLSRPDQGRNDCGMIAATNNLNYFANRFGIPRGNGPGELPADNQQIVEELRRDMRWTVNGTLDQNFVDGKNNFTARHGLNIRTTIVDFPTPSQIQDALANNKAVELSLKFRGTNLGHIVTPVGVNGNTLSIHDPMTKGAKSQENYDVQEAMDRTGKRLWLFSGYPNHAGYVIIERMFVQEYIQSDARTSLHNPSTIPGWIKNNAKWWSEGSTSDKEFASAIGYLVKEKVIPVEAKINSQGNVVISDTITIPSWIKNNAKWWSSGQIRDSDFLSGIEYMLSEKIIDFNSERVEFEKAIKILQDKKEIPSGSKVYVAKAAKGTILREQTRSSDSISISVPKIDGNYFGFYIDQLPEAKFEHPVSYAWVDLVTGNYQIVDALWPPILEHEGLPVDFKEDDYFRTGEAEYFSETWTTREAGDDQQRDPVYQTRHKSLAVGPAPKSIKPVSKVALLIDLGDNPPRSGRNLDGAQDMYLETEDLKRYLQSNGYRVDRVSQYWQNSYPYVSDRDHLINLIEDYGKAFDCTGGGCQHEFFLYLGGHGSGARYNSTTGALKFPGFASIYHPDGTGFKSALWYDDLARALDSFEPCIKKIFFLDSCYSGAYIVDQIETLDKMCEKSPCGMTVMTGSSGREVSWIGPNSSTKNFLRGQGVDNDGDGVRGDLRDMFEEMKKRNKQKTTHDEDTPFNANGVDSQLYLCKKDQPLCSLDGPVTMIFDDSQIGVHVAPQKEPATQIPDTSISVTNSAAEYFIDPDALECDEDTSDYTISATWELQGYVSDYNFDVTITDEDGGSYYVSGNKIDLTEGFGITASFVNLDPGIYNVELEQVQDKLQITIPEPTCTIEPVTPPPVTEVPSKDVMVLVMGGKYYPYSQFYEFPAHLPNCDAIHYHTEFQYVRSIDGNHLSDPKPTTCGFGKVGLVPIEVVGITQQQIDEFEADMGFEP